MSYQKTNWVNDETPLNAENMNNIEQGIADSVSQEDFDALVNNETQINSNDNHTFIAGNSQGYTGSYSVSIGELSHPGGRGVAVGYRAANDAAFGSVAIGYLASTKSSSNGRKIQLGEGSNSIGHSFQVFDDNIYKTDTHTLTVQNAEINGTPAYGVLSGTSAPTTTTVGAVGQFYLDTLLKTLYQCVEIDNTTSSYTWQNINAFTPQELTLTESSNVLTSTETFTKHVQIMIEFETDSIHAGFDLILHPYDSAICFVTYNVLVNDTPHFGQAYLNNLGNVVINMPTGLTFTNVKAHYIALE